MDGIDCKNYIEMKSEGGIILENDLIGYYQTLIISSTKRHVGLLCQRQFLKIEMMG